MRRTDDEKREILKRIITKIKSGATRLEASKSEGIVPSQVYKWSKKFNMPLTSSTAAGQTAPKRAYKKRVTNKVQTDFTEAGGDAEKPVVAFVGKPKDVIAALRELL